MADLETAIDTTPERRSADESSEDRLPSGFRANRLLFGRSRNPSNEYHFHDGNVDILTVDNVVFRVHESVLSFHSPYFKTIVTSRAHHCEDRRPRAGYPTLYVLETGLEVKWMLEIMYNGANR